MEYLLMYFMLNNLLQIPHNLFFSFFLTTDLISGISLKTYPKKALTLRRGNRRAKMQMFVQLLGLIPAAFYTQCVLLRNADC